MKLEDIEALCRAATEGPWNYEEERYSARCVIGIKPRDDRWVAHCQPELNGEANAKFIAASRTLMPNLVELWKSVLCNGHGPCLPHCSICKALAKLEDGHE